MSVAVGIVVVVVVLVALAAAIYTNVQLWASWTSTWRQLVERSPKSERTIIGQTTTMFIVVGAWFAAVLAQPFGLRDTLIYLVVVPVFVLVFVGVAAVGVHGYRSTGQTRSQGRRP